jgi:glycosyltransferase involved in cell wall biosynthesis
MRIALVWNADARLVDITVRHELFVRGFEALGHEVVTACTPRAAEGYAYPVHAVAERGDFADPALWRHLGADVAVMITWHMMTDVLAAIRSAGTRTIAIADSDGQVSTRVHPRATWQGMIATQPRWDLKVRATRHWLQRCLLHGRREDLDKIESTRHSDLVVFGTERARDNFRRILTHYRQHRLARRLTVAPYPVNEAFCGGPIPTRKRNRIVAIARWDSPQKDAGMMAAALRLFLAQKTATEIVLVGRGGEEWFRELARRFPQVRYLGVQSPEKIADILAESRSIVFASRWESGPIAAWEALALGSTVIGAPIPNLACLAADGRFGRVSATRRPADLARAIRDEMRAWEDGRRDSVAIASHWRARLRPAAVCRTLLDGLSTGAVSCLSRR